MFSNASKYAINATIYLALETNKENKVSVKEIATAIQVPIPFLAKLLQDLARKKIISSSKGPKGGFYLTEENKAQKLIVVVEEIDGTSKFNDCVLGLKNCSSDKPCPLHFSIEPLKNNLLKQLNENSISDFAEKVREGKTFLNL